MRALTTFEEPIAKDVVQLGNIKFWEFAAFLETPSGKLLEFSTRRNSYGADPSMDIISRTAPADRVVIHHNHLSQESLSFADWHGLTVFAKETFAHCADGTVYWGKVADEAAVTAKINNQGTAEAQATNLLFQILQAQVGGPADAAIASFFRKEVINRAMKIRTWVEYEFAWGTYPAPPPSSSGNGTQTWFAGEIGKAICSLMDQAAAHLAPLL